MLKLMKISEPYKKILDIAVSEFKVIIECLVKFYIRRVESLGNYGSICTITVSLTSTIQYEVNIHIIGIDA